MVRRRTSRERHSGGVYWSGAAPPENVTALVTPSAEENMFWRRGYEATVATGYCRTCSTIFLYLCGILMLNNIDGRQSVGIYVIAVDARQK